jgi:cell division protease FtsH
MTPANSQLPAPAGDAAPAPTPPPQAPQKPWRTEGLPPGRPEKPRLRRSMIAFWIGAYLLLFGVVTVQDRLAGPQPVPYTEFKRQVGDKNIGALFARGNSIQGELKKPAAVPRCSTSPVSPSPVSDSPTKPAA